MCIARVRWVTNQQAWLNHRSSLTVLSQQRRIPFVPNEESVSKRSSLTRTDTVFFQRYQKSEVRSSNLLNRLVSRAYNDTIDARLIFLSVILADAQKARKPSNWQEIRAKVYHHQRPFKNEVDMFKKKPHTVMIPRKVALITYKVVIAVILLCWSLPVC